MIHFDVENKEKELKELESKTTENDFWNDTDNSSKVLKQINSLKSKVEGFKKLNNELNNLLEMSELLQVEEDEELAKELLKSTYTLEKDIEKLEITTLLSGKYDNNNAILTIHPGAGGTEAQGMQDLSYQAGKAGECTPGGRLRRPRSASARPGSCEFHAAR